MVIKAKDIASKPHVRFISANNILYLYIYHLWYTRTFFP